MNHRKRSLCQFLTASATVGPASALVFNPLPPTARIAWGENSLRRDCENVTEIGGSSIDDCFEWEKDAKEGYQVACCVFDAVARGPPEDAANDARARTVWFPSVNDSKMVSALAGVVCSNSARLGGVEAVADFWPNAPATKIELRWPPSLSANEKRTCSEVPLSSIEAATEDTKRWVDNTLGRMSLCPYTRSMQHAAVGLNFVGVEEGPVGVRHASLPYSERGPGTVKSSQREAPTNAALLAAAFWNGVMELDSSPESDLSTLLVVAPPFYDACFVDFASTCDELLEPAVQATGADKIVGKAWFHPLYETSAIGHEKLLPGHALPSSMVEKFVDTYYCDGSVMKSSNSRDIKEGTKALKLGPDDIRRANDEVRHTPHATVNLLRRSQLRAAKEAEATMAVKRPNAVYARNVVRIASEWKDKLP